MKSEFGLIGLGVMGKSLARNLGSKGFRTSLYNRYVKGSEEGVADSFISGYEELSFASGFEDLKEFADSLEAPRKILLMVSAGKPVDNIIAQLLPLLQKGDILIDGGNSHYEDTSRRQSDLARKEIHFIGCGISGGEEGALNGPSLMPGGNREAYKEAAPFLEAIAAKDTDGNPCCSYLGPDAAGHYVKMVHNGIEYAEMQLLADVYTLLHYGSGMNPDEIAVLLEDWSSKESASYLLEITIDILRKKEHGTWLLDQVLDQAGNKGTGGWTTIAMAELGIPATMISSALFARYLSSFKDMRVQASKLYDIGASPDVDIETEQLHSAYQMARIINHHQGFELLREASNTYGWTLNLAEIARVWTNGCIIRSGLMEELKEHYMVKGPYLLDQDISQRINNLKNSLSEVVSKAARSFLPVPCLSEALNYFSGFIQAEGSAKLIQAQRDYFGAHTYRRKDDPEGPPQHSDWSS